MSTKPSRTRNSRTGDGFDEDSKEAKSYGLTTQLALARLREEIEKTLKEYERKFTEESCYRKLRSAFVKRYDSPLGWFATATSLLTILALIIGEEYVAALFLAAILSIDLYIVIRENNLRRSEIYRKTRHVLAELQLAEQDLCVDWQSINYPHLCCPISPCVSLQWTYRDGVIVNLPWALLVRGDSIVLRPGHVTPEACTQIDGNRSFNAHEIYGVSQIADPPVRPVARSPLPDIVCVLQTTPYAQNLRIILENSLKRPPTIYNQQRYLLVTKYIQQWGFICALITTLFVGILRINGIGFSSTNKNDWKFILIESPVAAVVPLLPLVFPIMWISVNLWGVARLQCFLKTPQLLNAKVSEKSFEEDLDTPTFDYANIPLMRSSVLKYWLQLWRGDSELLPRSANVVQVLGSITALCCVDKKGILSWPNPTAEKVFFLHDTENDHDDRRTNSQSTMTTESDEPVIAVNHNNKDSGIIAEVLDLTHDQHCPFRLEFDDHEWKAHIKSLKPLGLAILLNTCSPLTHAHYSKFCGHVTAVAMLDKDLVPVVNRYAIVETRMNSFLHGRCLCELAKLIGFTDHATDRFTLEGQLASYRHLQPDVIRRDIRFAKQLQLSSKVKVPFPHSLSVVMRENPGGYLSLFTQGTADMLLDSCDDFWDGKDLRPLSQQDRKRALDFYQRSALTAYCTAFAYRPLRHSIHGALSGIQQTGPIAYLELPPEAKIRMPHADKMHCDFDGTGHTKLSHSISTDSLLFSETKDEDINDVDGCFEMQCHQVFIGMVTMQYQAQMDIVQLVERLERACIRFVHFSKENELRSRVFSEKMGLESGWNCHISLMSEPDDKLSTNTGAPTGINITTTCGSSPQKHQNTSITTVTGKSEAQTQSMHEQHEFCHHHEQRQRQQFSGAASASLSASTSNHAITTATTLTISISNNTTNRSLPSPTTLNLNRKNHKRDLPRIITSNNTNQTHDQTNFMSLTHEIAGDPVVAPTQPIAVETDLNCLLPPTNLEASKTLSNSAPGAISEADFQNVKHDGDNASSGSSSTPGRMTDAGSQESLNSADGGDHVIKEQQQQRRTSQDSALEENCRSISILTESTEQSAPVQFDMSNRAKLPRGIENIRPHLEQVDNVPLQVSLFTDCSAEATRQMLDIMQSYGEIVVCLGSSASNSNAEIFLQADCSIAVEPLYPQVCQDIPAYTEMNIYNNRLRHRKPQHKDIDLDQTAAEQLLESGLYSGGMNGCSGIDSSKRPMQSQGNTVSPVYLSRLLNSLPCSISVCRDDPLSLVAIIELSRRFSLGLWNTVQFWACCAGAVSLVNILCACLYLPVILTPLMVIYLMCVPVPLIALALAHIEVDAKIMNRATGKKQTEYDSRVFGFVIWCYGCKFVAPILITILTYCAFMAHPIQIMEVDEDNLHINLHIARIFTFLGILLHFVIISASFVHRDHSLWQKNPFSNRIWTATCLIILILHTVICLCQVLLNDDILEALKSDVWPAVIFLYCGCLISLVVTEICKWQEIKFNTRYQRRARLDFGTKLGMNSPF